MASSAANTKIEIVSEAIETLVLATVVAATGSPRNVAEREANHQNVVDARATVKAALKELLTPTLRVVAAA